MIILDIIFIVLLGKINKEFLKFFLSSNTIILGIILIVSIGKMYKKYSLSFFIVVWGYFRYYFHRYHSVRLIKIF